MGFQRSVKDVGQPVYLYNGKFAGRYYCTTPQCVSSISVSAHDDPEGPRTLCIQCEQRGPAWWQSRSSERVLLDGTIEVDEDEEEGLNPLEVVDDGYGGVAETAAGGKT